MMVVVVCVRGEQLINTYCLTKSSHGIPDLCVSTESDMQDCPD